MLARRSYVEVNYNGIDITTNIQNDLINFRYTDNASEKADDIELTLKDPYSKWLNEWQPQKGDLISAAINVINWSKEGDNRHLNCGEFIIDEPEYSGRPRILTLKAISIPSNSNFTASKKSKLWRNVNTKLIASEIASKSGLKLFYDCNFIKVYDVIEQTETSDMSFLSKICSDEGLAFKVTNNTIVIFNEAEYEKRATIYDYKETRGEVKAYNLKTTLTNTAYVGCNVKYYDPLTEKTINYLFALKDIDEKVDKVYQLNTRVKSVNEAKILAQKTLRKLNKKEYQGSLQVMGNTYLVGGSCVNLLEFGNLSGKYYINTATHNVGNGYSTDIGVRKVLEGY